MKKVITYGSFDMLHYGHIRLLERAKALGDYLIVGVTSDDYDKIRGKINLQQTLMERLEAVKATGIPDEVIVEEYEGQKIDDILRYDVDIFTVGSDWVGYFDYLKEYCKVIYLERTEGISSSYIRSQEHSLRIGLVGEEEDRVIVKYCDEFSVVNGTEISGLCTTSERLKNEMKNRIGFFTDDFDKIVEVSDAIYIISHPSKHYSQIKKALSAGKHVLVESPVVLDAEQCKELFEIAKKKKLVLMESIKTAYSTAYNRLLLLVKSGKIGKVVSVDATCTSIRNVDRNEIGYSGIWNSICMWGPAALLPVFQLLGTEYVESRITSFYLDKDARFDAFTHINFLYKKAIATIKVGRGVKSEGELIISGTKGYVYVPAPWWKTDYFEIRYEDPNNNRRYYYQLDGEGIRYELVSFVKEIVSGHKMDYLTEDVSIAITKIMGDFYDNKVTELE